MAADYLAISRTNRTQMGNQVIKCANDAVDLCDRIAALNNCGQHQFTGGDYTVFEAQVGVAAGQGANLLTLLGLMHTIFNTATDVTGVNRAAQIAEFKARLAGQ